MSKTKVSLTVDLGNSQNRVSVQWKSSVGVERRLLELPNRFARLASDYKVPEDYNGDNSYVFRHGDDFYAAGLLAEREFGTVLLRPSAVERKYNSVPTILSLNISIIEACNILREAGLDLDEVEWSVSVLLPPADVEFGTAIMEERIRSITEVHSMYPEVQNQGIEIVNVGVFAEGVVAFAGTLFTRGGKVRKSYLELHDATVLLVDIGAGTSDYVVIRGRKPVDATKHTVDVGGNNVHQNLRTALRRKGVSVPEAEAIQGSIKGFIPNGSRNRDVSEEVSVARDAIAQTLVLSVQNFLEESQFPILNISHVLMTGGGSMGSQIEGLESLSETVYKYLQRLSPNLEMVAEPFEFVTVDVKGSNAEESVETPAPRMMNLLGAGILSEKFL